MSELEKMGRNLMDIALQYTHPNFEGMYPDWGAVCNIGEELVRMSDQPQLNENQQIVLDWLKWKRTRSWASMRRFKSYRYSANGRRNRRKSDGMDCD